MTLTTRLGPAALFALVSILAAAPANAVENTKLNPDPQLCEAFLRDLKTWRAQAVSIGCKIPATNEVVAAADTTEFPPVVTNEPAPSTTEFPPVVTETEKTEPAPSFPPVEQASNEPAPASFPPVETGSTSGSGSSSSSGSGGGSSSFPPVEESTAGMEESFEEDQPIRAAIKEKLLTIKEEVKEEVKARIRDAIVLKSEEVKARIRDELAIKSEEVKERVKEKIKRKLEDVISHHKNNDDNAPTLRRKAKDAVKRLISEHRHNGGGGLMNKLAQLRRR